MKQPMTKKEKKWYNERPLDIKKMIDETPMQGLYRMESTGKDFYSVISYGEDGTLRVGRINFVTGKPMHDVFEVKPEDLIFWKWEKDYKPKL